MTTVCTADQMRAAEQTWFDAHPGKDLMAVAAHAVAVEAEQMLGAHEGRRVLILVGGGDNGGDGLFAATELASSGHSVELLSVLGIPHAEGWRAALAAGCRQVTPTDVLHQRYDLAVDSVLGIGGRPGIPRVLMRTDEWLVKSGTPVLAVDLPSGLVADSGEVATAVHATVTITFASRKWCHVAHPAARRCGDVVVADIGVDVLDADDLVTREDLAHLWPVPGPRSDKYSRGVVGLDTGSAQYSGAGVLGALGALRTGPGMVRCAGPDNVGDRVIARAPSVVVGEGRVQAWVVGSGWGSAPGNAARLDRRLADGVPVVVDADALAVLPRRIPGNCLLTPHAGELARMLGVDRSEVEADPRGHCLAGARMFAATVLLKGSIQWVATPSGDVVAALPGPAWTGQAGSGDVLAGMCGTLLATGMEARDAAVCAASLQALTATLNPGPWSPDQLANRFPSTIAELLG
ncbi:bifunctional ADP-dependent NAD(P)H-hydrate dehydratase/NAD(P)H-hydrate epimerase [Acidipropionibacterium acidipropionici]|uniref:bifunctional ADP-dependent NAD(P)H-hydrate dehydratase/NAD(P)H-hydrate epimerase n=1 Tax=Acidipropionibacterium acidipropionici TaxID=1748 RepID=UPI00110BC6A5|nr:bifunctional ADP-dependent NAD(P)H-hydrate dehydratase/NAD(P)H-hydrate epimerase [Acidipropionibacterium acidipropionici]QCV94478.1 bifunctional ADP-dependent NAD(P)H-hydrate dehydratase/NAD(P)H-hydrate epimerase [Acidipropionibacterium acidipropionici]